MLPVVVVAGLPLNTHDVFTALGIAVAFLVFLAEAWRRRAPGFPMFVAVTGALVGGAIGERLSGLAADLAMPGPTALVSAWEYGSRSILGGLTGAYAGVEIAKRLIGYRERTGNLFAPAVAAGMAVGRVGCLLTEAPGRPTSLPWGIHAPPSVPECPGCVSGVATHPSFAYEIAFQLLAFAALCWLRSRITAPGELLTVYLAGYAMFRFLVEFTRANQILAFGLSAPQCFLLLAMPLLVARLVHRYRRGVFDALLPRRAAPAKEVLQ
jgi:prolipoprotein diacylglyceryltransferase